MTDTRAAASNVLVLGGASWNRKLHVPSLPAGPATLTATRVAEGPGGTGAGKAMVLAALGHRVTLHCALGRDGAAERIVSACAARGIAMLVETHDTPTPRHLNVLDSQGERCSVIEAPEPEGTAFDEARLADAIRQSDTVFLNLAASSRAALDLLDGAPAEVVLDLHDWDGANPWHAPFIPHADVIQLSGVALADEEGTVVCLLQGRARQVAVTRGARGVMIAHGARRATVTAVRAAMRDANGAGDAFCAALWHAQRAGLDVPEAGRFAAAAGAFAVESDDPFPLGVTASDVAARAHGP